MKEEDYIKDRLEAQIEWYDKKSVSNQAWFKRLRLIEIICASLIPLLAGLSSTINYSEWIIGILGVTIAISASINGLYKFQENWIQYRNNAEILKHEKYLYVTEAYPYNSDSKYKLLVSQIEALISKENSNWSRYIERDEEPQHQK